MGNKHWEKFNKKFLRKIPKLAAGAMNILSFAFAIISICTNNFDLGWAVVISIIIFNSVLVLAVAIYETYIHYKAQKIENNYTNIIDKNNEFAKKLISFSNDILQRLNVDTYGLIEINTEFQESTLRFEAMNSKADSETDGNEIKAEYAKTKNEYEKRMLRRYNSFLEYISFQLKNILESALSAKGLNLVCSIAVKQFDGILNDVNSYSDVKVITAFRDRDNYYKGKREIGQIEFKIQNNTDFMYCLRNKYFLKNNIKKSDKTYNNESVDFLNNYNCTIVAPIKLSNTNSYYGFLACDVKTVNEAKEEVLDEQMAEIVVLTANIIATYFDNLDYYWDYVLEDDFLNIVYAMKRKQEVFVSGEVA